MPCYLRCSIEIIDNFYNYPMGMYRVTDNWYIGISKSIRGIRNIRKLFILDILYRSCHTTLTSKKNTPLLIPSISSINIGTKSSPIIDEFPTEIEIDADFFEKLPQGKIYSESVSELNTNCANTLLCRVPSDAFTEFYSVSFIGKYDTKVTLISKTPNIRDRIAYNINIDTKYKKNCRKMELEFTSNTYKFMSMYTTDAIKLKVDYKSVTIGDFIIYYDTNITNDTIGDFKQKFEGIDNHWFNCGVVTNNRIVNVPSKSYLKYGGKPVSYNQLIQNLELISSKVKEVYNLKDDTAIYKAFTPNTEAVVDSYIIIPENRLYSNFEYYKICPIR